MTSSEATDIERMEATEKRRLMEFEKLKTNMREKKRNRQMADRKVVCRISTKSYLANLREHSFRNLANVSFYTNKFKTEVLDNDVVPWLYEKAFKFVADLEV